MKGLCQKCHSSNVEIVIQDGIPICEDCSKKSE
jgi:ribosomal protein L37AE/L43A